MQIEGTELPHLLSNACKRRMSVLMVSCANSIPITCFQISAGKSPAQCSGCCPLPWSLSETLSFHRERGFSCWDWCNWPCLYLGAVKCHPRGDSCWAELHKEEQLVIWCEHYTNTGFSPSLKASASQRRLDSSKMSWAVVFTGSSLCACSQCSCSPAPYVCVCVLPDPELELWLKLSFIAVSY